MSSEPPESAAPAEAPARADDKISVVVVDDHDAFREGLAVMLVDHGLNVVADAGDGEAAIIAVVEHAPDVVLMDLQMPGLTGLEATRAIAESAPATAVLILTVSAAEDDVVEAMLSGGCGYLVKGASPETVVAGIQAAARGETIISTEVASRLFTRLRVNGPDPSSNDLPVSLLTAREIEILRLLARGRHNEAIADELLISPFTVRNHISNLLRKLQLHNRTQAAAYAVRQGL